jgi:uncharacterized protein
LESLSSFSTLLRYMKFLCVIVFLSLSLAAQSSPDIAALQKAAEQGDAKAQLRLAEAYEEGAGVPKDDALAVHWLRRAAEDGNVEAQNSLGVAFRLGRGVSRDLEAAVGWYHRAAAAGSGKAMFNLGTAYYNGEGVPYSKRDALTWFLLAQRSGWTDAQQAVDMVTKELGPKQTMGARLNLAHIYEMGSQVPRDPQAALAIYLSLKDDPGVQVNLGAMYRAGRGVERDFVESLRWCRRAADKNHPLGMSCIGYAYHKGEGVKQDLKQAIKWYERSAESGYPQALEQIAAIYLSGELGKRDEERALMLYLVERDLFKIATAGPLVQQLASQMTLDDVKKAREKAEEWVLQHRDRKTMRSLR